MEEQQMEYVEYATMEMVLRDFKDIFGMILSYDPFLKVYETISKGILISVQVAIDQKGKNYLSIGGQFRTKGFVQACYSKRDIHVAINRAYKLREEYYKKGA